MFKRIPPEGIAGEAAFREAVEFRAVIDAVYAAINARIAALYATNAKPAPDVRLAAIFDDRAIVELDGRHLAFGYSIDEAYQVTLQEPVPVVQEWKTVQVREALADHVMLEAKGDAKSTGRFSVVVIRAGLSRNGNYYTDAALRDAVPLFEGARVFVKSDEEHVAGKGKDVRNLIGQLVEPRFVEGAAADSGAITATLALINPEDAIGVKLREAFARGMQHLFGLSIDATGRTTSVLREGKRVRAVSAFTKVNSVDLIVEPGAGGGLVRMVEATDEPAATEEQDEMDLRKRLFEAIREADPTKAAAINLETISDEELAAAFREACTAPQPGAGGDAKPALSLQEVEARIAQAEARSYARVRIVESRLPKPAQERLQKRFDALERFTEADVDAAIKEEREYLARFTESGRVAMPDIELEDRAEKIRDMLDAFFDPAHKNHRDVQSFKECYVEITGDRRVTGRLRECDQTRLREALDTSSFDQVLGDAITRRMVAEYNAAPYPDFRLVATDVPVSDFRTQRRTRFGGYGDLPVVNQAAAYTALTSPTDEEATYAATKRGGLETITLEMIRNDDVGAIRRIPVKLGRAARRTLTKFVFDFFRLNPTIYDSVAFFAAGHNNLFAAALSAAELSTHRLAMLKQTELTSADRIGIAPRRILVPVELQETAINLFNRNTNNDKTFQQTWNMDVVPVWYWTDANDWCTVADPADIPTIEIGFLDGREEPELFVQDLPNVGSMFSNDQLTYKIRHVYGGAVTDYRGATKAVVP